MKFFNRSGAGDARADFLIVGLGNPGSKYARTRHNVGFMVCEQLIERYDLGKPKSKFRARFVTGRLGPGGPRVAILMPETFMNESGKSVGPARGDLRLAPEQVIVVHDEIDFPFGRVESRLGGGSAGHNGLKSVRTALATTEYQRVRVGVGRPDTRDPELVSAYVLSAFSEPASSVAELITDAVEATVALASSPPPA